MNTNFFDFACGPFQYTLSPPQHRNNDDCAVWSARPLRIQKCGREPAIDVPFVPNLRQILKRLRKDEVFRRAEVRGEQRRLRRLAALKARTAACNSYEVEPPSPTGGSQPQSPSPPYTTSEVYNQRLKPTSKASYQNEPKGDHTLSTNSPLTTPNLPHRTSTTHDSHTPYSESRGELQRQFAISQRPLQCPTEPLHSVERDAHLGGLGELGYEDVRAHGLRFHTDHPGAVSESRAQTIGKGTATYPEKPKKVRFAAVVECFQF
ncbi:hypothetical protein BJ322DRAFT_1018525 [Thelephora terrestris]|uniref:Uncharacterized protein n=1 Tax=Thelephora terrestris TaxID=56493 RepID=A0A9P6L899_9AGAM|nr:hypothetical protein BJ322DRAFT_1018525 [Thelephora terrestris]